MGRSKRPGTRPQDYALPPDIPRGMIPRSWRTIVKWFELGKIREGDPEKPYRLLRPGDKFENAVVIDGSLCYQEYDGNVCIICGGPFIKCKPSDKVCLVCRGYYTKQQNIYRRRHG